MSEVQALAIAGAYGSAVYLLQPVGPWFADRLVPAQTMVMAAAIINMCGHISLATIPGPGGLLVGLSLVTIGTGGLAPNTHSMVGRIYKGHSPRCDSRFAIFSTGILVGALFGPLVTGRLQTDFGFHYGFGAAAVGIIVGLPSYFFGRNALLESARVVPNPISPAGKWKAAGFGTAVLSVIAVLIATGLISTRNLKNYVLGAIFLVSIVYFIAMFRSKKVREGEQERVKAFIPIFITRIVFWTMVLQLFTTFAVYAYTRVDFIIAGYTTPAA